MCAPMLGAAIGMMATVAQAGAEQSAKETDYAAKSATWRQNVVNAQAAGRDEQRQIITKQLQEQEKTAQKVHVSYLEQAQKQATATVQAAAAGTGGVSLDNILDDIAQKSELNRTYAAMNYKYVVQDTAESLKSSDQKIMDRINSVPRPQEPANTSGITILGGLAGMAGKMGSGGGLGMG